ncbi:MAG: hypothetical protein LC754_10555 [Acidobacteria bacterium]|nr:hypothetical protein [Acidobacteriota bacterium]
MTAEKRPAGYWYFTKEYFCTACGETRRYRERRDNPKPESREERATEIVLYCGCMDEMFR